MIENQSTNIVYLNDDVDYQTLCGSTALASTLARSSVPGLRWMVRGGGVIQRGGWGALWTLTILVTFILCMLYLIFQTDENSVLRKQEISLSPSIPSIFICPNYQSSSVSKQRVEKKIPVMKYLWDKWINVMKANSALDISLPWGNESKRNLDFYNKVMFEGGRLDAEGCGKHLTNCDNFVSEKVFTDVGVCLKIDLGTCV